MAVIKLSSKGQIVIPASMRDDLNEGEELVIIKDDERFILKKAEALTEKMKEDLEFARRTEEALKRYDAGEFISMDSDQFLKELEKW
ncbi:MAG: AbrB/MazE/SpoVT family DNA-binding domain-containing protein [candidate division Zixibacteria bacterium]|nr:AbrB/MazE/SpoVT family DNA-binding domain-containing protein [candidate division Zixibacteria bacterium]